MLFRRRRSDPVVIAVRVLAPAGDRAPSPQMFEMALDEMRRKVLQPEDVEHVATETEGVFGDVDLSAMGLKAFEFRAEVRRGDR